MQKKLTIPQQIELMREEGIGFQIIGEAEAEEYITAHTIYFKIKTFAKNYEKYTRGEKLGQYINLEFAYLKELAVLDSKFRRMVLDICLDIEYSMKVDLNRAFTENSREDGYTIVASFLEKNPYILRKIKKMAAKKSPYTTLVYQRFLEEPAIWNLIEVISFGEFCNLYTYYYRCYPPESEIAGLLQAVKYLRNSAAHNNHLLNDLRGRNAISPNLLLSTKVAAVKSIGKEARKKRLQVPVLHDFAAVLFVFDSVIHSHGIRTYTMENLEGFLADCREHQAYFTKNQPLVAAYHFIEHLITYFKNNPKNQ